MYATAFGFQQAPFSIAPDPRYLFMSDRHREALAHLLYGLGAGGGFVLLTGEIGTGKTTICRCFLEQMPAHCDVAYVFNPKQSAIELLRTINDEFGVPHAAAAPGVVETIKDCVDPLNVFLLESHAAGRHAVLVIDEAQNLSADVLEQLRLLTNLETAERKLLQIVLIGQPELRELLAQPSLEQLAQRVIARFHLDALSPAEAEAYVLHRLAVAGWTGPPLFDRRALRRIHKLTGGVPRRINLLCDRALLGAYAAGLRCVDVRMVERAAREVFYRQSPGEAATARRRRAARVGAGLLAGCAVAAAAALAVWTNRPQPAAAKAVDTVEGAPAVIAKPAEPAPVEPVAQARPPELPPRPALPEFDLAQALPRLPRTEDTALYLLAPAWGVTALEAGPACPALARRSLQCYRANRAGLDVLRQLDRPALLALDTPTGRAWVLLRGLDAEGVTLDVAGVRQHVATAALANWWRGDLLTLWRVADPAPAALDARLALAMTGLPANLSRTERITRFQLAQGLPPVGSIGPVTAMRLNRVSGVDEPRLLQN